MRGPGLATIATAALLEGGNGHGLPIRVETPRMLLKAHIEGGQRAVYMEPSVQSRDVQGERILAKGLQESIPYFLKHGRIDLDHGSVDGTIRGKRVDPYATEIGRPINTQVSADGRIQVKAAIFSASAPGNRWTEYADLFWDSLQTVPPVLWFPSVHGLVLNERGVVESGGLPTQEITGILWQSIGLSRTPVNPGVPNVTTVPLRTFTKALSDAAGVRDLLSMLHGGKARELPEVAPELSQDQVLQVMESLASAKPDTPPSQLLSEAEASGIPQANALAVWIALLGMDTTHR